VNLKHYLAIKLLAMTVMLAGCQSLISDSALKRYPAPGKLVDIGGRRLQLDCRGSGSPIVVLQEGGGLYGSLAWHVVQDALATSARVCTYSRAGLMWSDPAPGSFHSEEVANDLHALLIKAGELPPYVLVGHSRGGLYNLIYNGLYSNDVAALVFVDSSHPDQDARFRAAKVPASESVPGYLQVTARALGSASHAAANCGARQCFVRQVNPGVFARSRRTRRH
jgi:pimeloyl-ACP methyl ester carboxylesterase